jgi:nucleoside 2-deoxyribosyltransferase
MKKKQRSLNVFFSAEVFNLKHIIGNAYLAEAIYERSHGKYLCALPQDFDPRGTAARSIRDHHIRALVGCDLALFSFDGPDLDSGTVAEFMLAKFADIPAVILRSDRRGANDRAWPWNPLVNYYPRTVIIGLDGLAAYKAVLKKRQVKVDEVMRLAGLHGSADSQRVCDEIAGHIVRAFDRVREAEPVMPRHLREEIYNWIPLMPGLRGKEKALRREFERCLERKVQRDLL